MSTRRTPPLSLEGSREVKEEMSRPPADTPERRRTMDLVHEIEAIKARRAMAPMPPANPTGTVEGET